MVGKRLLRATDSMYPSINFNSYFIYEIFNADGMYMSRLPQIEGAIYLDFFPFMHVLMIMSILFENDLVRSIICNCERL